MRVIRTDFIIINNIDFIIIIKFILEVYLEFKIINYKDKYYIKLLKIDLKLDNKL